MYNYTLIERGNNFINSVKSFTIQKCPLYLEDDSSMCSFWRGIVSCGQMTG